MPGPQQEYAGELAQARERLEDIEAQASHYRGPQRESARPQRGRRDNEGRLRARLDGLHELLKSTDKAFDLLVQRIYPTLNPGDQDATEIRGTGDEVVADSPLGEQLEVMRCELQALYDRISAVIDRIEV